MFPKFLGFISHIRLRKSPKTKKKAKLIKEGKKKDKDKNWEGAWTVNDPAVLSSVDNNSELNFSRDMSLFKHEVFAIQLL